MKRYGQTSPLVAYQRALYNPQGFGFLGGSVNPGGQATTSIYSGPPVGQGAGSGAAVGAAQGASVGAVAGPIGIAIGAIAGAIGGAIAGAIGKKDPEQYSFDAANNLYKQNPNNVYAIVNKYLPLAGLFDLNIKTNIPIYKRYGRMGEQRFLTDMATLIYQAAQSGKITGKDTVQTIMVNVVQPWIDSWGFGPMSDPNQGFINTLILGLIMDYVTGAQGNWKAIGGDYPFGSLPAFALPQAAAAQPAPVSAPAQPAASSSPAGNILVQVAQQTAATAAPPVPTSILSTDGATAVPGSNTGLKSSSGTVFYFGAVMNPAGGDATIWVNGAPLIGSGATKMVLSGGQVYVSNSLGNWYQWTGSTFSQIPGPPQAPAATPVSTPPMSTTVAIPSGYLAATTDLSSGLPVYAGPDGRYYAWTGTTMTPYTGTVTGGTVIQAGTIVANTGTSVPSMSTGSQQLYNTANPLPYGTSPDLSALSATPGQNAPAQPALTAAGVSTSGSSWMTWAGLAAIAGLIFATARPQGRVSMPRRSTRR